MLLSGADLKFLVEKWTAMQLYEMTIGKFKIVYNPQIVKKEAIRGETVLIPFSLKSAS